MMSKQPNQKKKLKTHSEYFDNETELDLTVKKEPLKGPPIEKLKRGTEPKQWSQALKNIQEMRILKNAAVDTMGAEASYDKTVPDPEQRFQILVSLMLSSQTKDQVTHSAMLRLRSEGLTVQKIIDMPEEELGELIKPVGFWRTKAKHLKKAANILKSDYNSDIPKTVKDLCSLPGVGPKMAHLAMKISWDEITGIAVDTHVHRISNRLGWVKTKKPENTRLDLESWMPRCHWNTINNDLVGFGQTVCLPIKPKCSDCLNNKLCPSAFSF